MQHFVDHGRQALIKHQGETSHSPFAHTLLTNSCKKIKEPQWFWPQADSWGWIGKRFQKKDSVNRCGHSACSSPCSKFGQWQVIPSLPLWSYLHHRFFWINSYRKSEGMQLHLAFRNRCILCIRQYRKPFFQVQLPSSNIVAASVRLTYYFLNGLSNR